MRMLAAMLSPSRSVCSAIEAVSQLMEIIALFSVHSSFERGYVFLAWIGDKNRFWEEMGESGGILLVFSKT